MSPPNDFISTLPKAVASHRQQLRGPAGFVRGSRLLGRKTMKQDTSRVLDNKYSSFESHIHVFQGYNPKGIKSPLTTLPQRCSGSSHFPQGPKATRPRKGQSRIRKDGTSRTPPPTLLLLLQQLLSFTCPCNVTWNDSSTTEPRRLSNNVVMLGPARRMQQYTLS